MSEESMTVAIIKDGTVVEVREIARTAAISTRKDVDGGLSVRPILKASPPKVAPTERPKRVYKVERDRVVETWEVERLPQGELVAMVEVEFARRTAERYPSWWSGGTGGKFDEAVLWMQKLDAAKQTLLAKVPDDFADDKHWPA